MKFKVLHYLYTKKKSRYTRQVYDDCVVWVIPNVWNEKLGMESAFKIVVNCRFEDQKSADFTAMSVMVKHLRVVNARLERRYGLHSAFGLNDSLIRSIANPAWQRLMRPPYHVFRPKVTFRGREYAAFGPFLLRKFDLWYFRFLGMKVNVDSMSTCVWQRRQIGGVGFSGYLENYVPTLQMLCMRTISSYNRVYGGDLLGPYTVHSHMNLDGTTKLAQDIAKYGVCDTNTPRFSPGFDKDLKEGIKLWMRVNNLDRFVGSIEWDMNVYDIFKIRVEQNSSSGLRPNPNDMYMGDTIVRRQGKKKDVEFGYKTMLADAINTFYKTGKFYLPPVEYLIALKPEIFNVFCHGGYNSEDRCKFYAKCREFFIGNVLQYLVDYILQSPRHHLEKFKGINIGLNWWGGGAYKFASKYDLDGAQDIEVSEGDFKGLDTTIHRVLLEMYYAFGKIYFKFKNDKDKNLYKAMMKWAIENMTLKTVYLFGDVWVQMVGKMASGVYDTSHGDSWVVTVLYFAYVCSVIRKNPKYKQLIIQKFMTRKAGFETYGDDNFSVLEKCLQKIIPYSGFAMYVKDNLGMEIKTDSIKVGRFLSDPMIHFMFGKDVGNGYLSGVGTVFLKRHFVSRPAFMPVYCASIVPYRELGDYFHRPFIGISHVDAWDDLISTIGLAWDTMGTNYVAYVFLRFVYNSIKSLLNCSKNEFEQKLKSRVDSNPILLKKMMHRQVLSSNDIHFPSLREMHERHVVVDRTYEAAPVNWNQLVIESPFIYQSLSK